MEILPHRVLVQAWLELINQQQTSELRIRLIIDHLNRILGSIPLAELYVAECDAIDDALIPPKAFINLR